MSDRTLNMIGTGLLLGVGAYLVMKDDKPIPEIKDHVPAKLIGGVLFVWGFIRIVSPTKK